MWAADTIPHSTLSPPRCPRAPGSPRTVQAHTDGKAVGSFRLRTRRECPHTTTGVCDSSRAATPAGLSSAGVRTTTCTICDAAVPSPAGPRVRTTRLPAASPRTIPTARRALHATLSRRTLAVVLQSACPLLGGRLLFLWSSHVLECRCSQRAVLRTGYTRA